MASAAAVAIGAATVAIWVYLLLFRGGFWWLPYRRTPVAASVGGRAVVAVIPARDEAEVIGRAVASLASQDYEGPFRIVVVDDQSGDGTAEVALAAGERAGARDRVTVLHGRPLPAGWTGKLWAVRQGVEAAQAMRPDYLLLTDADIVHSPRNLRELVSRCETKGYHLVSLMVRLNCRSIWEILLIPAFVFFFFKLYPPRWVADPARRTAGAAGGCMLVKAATLDRIGGIDSIRGEIIDDCELARRVKSVSKIWLGPARDTMSVREYRSWRVIWEMIVRSAFAQLGYSPVMLTLTFVMLALIYLAPPLLLLSSQPAAIWCGAFAWLGMSMAFLPTLRAYEAPLSIAPLLPLMSLFYVAATLASAVLFWQGRGGYWKGRVQAPQPDST
jgi:hopene-associated glycosyltransferase HpnB